MPALVAGGMMAGCSDDGDSSDVGALCHVSLLDADIGASMVIDPRSDDCQSKLCLYPGPTPKAKALCTRACEADGDCPSRTSACEQFACEVAIQTGTWGSQKLCVCKQFP